MPAYLLLSLCCCSAAAPSAAVQRVPTLILPRAGGRVSQALHQPGAARSHPLPHPRLQLSDRGRVRRGATLTTAARLILSPVLCACRPAWCVLCFVLSPSASASSFFSACCSAEPRGWFCGVRCSCGEWWSVHGARARRARHGACGAHGGRRTPRVAQSYAINTLAETVQLL